MTHALLLALAIDISSFGFACSAWFCWDVWKAGGLWALYAELAGIVRAPEVPGQRGWTPAQWADPAWGVDPVTGGPRYDGRTS